MRLFEDILLRPHVSGAAYYSGRPGDSCVEDCTPLSAILALTSAGCTPMAMANIQK